MLEIRDFEPDLPWSAQFEEPDPGPVTVINTFVVPAGQYEPFAEAWRLGFELIKVAPGFVSAKLLRGIGQSRVVTVVAVWESVADLRAVLGSPEFKELLPLYPDGTVLYPALEREIDIPGLRDT
ncbi:antibiotic biosynthesis monooxygenase family protein [Amycolatopsis silviterrae]|uniref:Antibiotic biosynthesis monooxygenase family protein n=1 Tax=Amycolatopsis silviterrae TaxID=1656914 RepID=A0ABW5H4Y1_9PSEU